MSRSRHDDQRPNGGLRSHLFFLLAFVLISLPAVAAVEPDWDIVAPGDYSTTTNVKIAGDVNGDGFSDLIVGYPEAIGSGYTYQGSGFARVIYGAADGPGTGQAATELIGDWNGNNFASAVSSAGDVNGDGYDDVIVGWSGYSWPAPDNAGRILVYLGGSGGISTSDAWQYTGTVTQDFLGAKVATAGDVNGDGFAEIVFAGTSSAPRIVYGSASGPTGTPQTIPWPSSPHSDNTFAPAGDLNADGYDDLVLGEPYSDNGTYNRGRIALYLGRSSGLLTTPSQVVWQTVSGTDYRDGMGSLVGMAGDVNGDGYGDLLVGASGDGTVIDGHIEHKGRFLVYAGKSTGIDSTPLWYNWNPGPTQEIAPGVITYPHYGYVGETAGDFNGDGYADLVLTCAEHDSFAGIESGNGLVQIFYGGLGGPQLSAAVQYEGPDRDLMGTAAACGGDLNGDGYGDVVFTGKPGTDLFGFAGHGNGPDYYRQWYVSSTGSGGRRGETVAVLGDVNGDGFSDAAVGSPDGGYGGGGVEVFFGTSYGLPTSPAFSLGSFTADDRLGEGLSRAGDLNGDGYEDLLVGAPGVNGHGRVSAYFGSASGFSTPADWQVEGSLDLAEFGAAVLGGFDCNADGYSDVLVGEPSNNGQSHYEGRCYLYLGGPTGPQTTAQWVFDSGDFMSFTGRTLATAGDVNRDGYADVLISAPGHRLEGGDPSGRVYLFLGTAGGLAATPVWYKDAANSYDNFGCAIGHTDLNRDGYSEVLIGISNYGSTGRVEAYSWNGAGSLGATPYYTVNGPTGSAHFGAALAGAGDINGDGYGDAVIGSPLDNKAYVLLGGFSNSPSVPSHIHLSDWSSQDSGYTDVDNEYGYAVGGEGDFNGDGFADLLVGDPGYHENGADQGTSYCYLGNGFDQAGGRALNLRQSYSQPIPLRGSSVSTSTFRLDATGFSAAGRSDVRLSYRLATTASDPADGTVQSGSWLNTGGASGGSSTTGLTAAPAGLQSNTGYAWQARVESNNMYFPRAPWRVISAATPFEMHLKTAGPPPSPDLTVTAITPDSANGGSPTEMTATIANYGLQAAAACLANVTLDGVLAGENIPVSALAAGATTTITCDLGYLTVAANVVTVDVDVANTVTESDEGNNSLDHHIDVINYLNLYLSADGSGDFATLAEALAAINPAGNIILADGVYTGTGNRDLTLDGKAVTVRSASGAADDCCLDFGGSASDPHHGFRVTNGAELTIQNLTLSNGYRDAGSALSVYLADVLASGVTFTGGEASNAGGAVNLNSAGGRFDNCRFSGNHAVWGGGALYLNNSAPVISLCVFDANTCDHWGGAVHGYNAAIFELASCTFYGNGADQGSSVYVRDGSRVAIGNTILALGTGGQPVWNNGGIIAGVTCSDVYGNAAGDFVGALAGYDDPSNENFSLDPEFCDPAAGNLHVSAGSPCSEILNSGCGLVGALTAGCGFEYTVAPDGSGDFPTIQAAVDGIVDGSIINLLAGRFTGAGNRDVALNGRQLLIRYQGADAAECVVDGEGTASENHRLFNLSAAASLTLQNVTLTGGYSSYGGGVILNGSTLQAEGVVFDGQQGSDGGAIFGSNGSDLQLTDCRFLNNSTTDSGAAVGLNASSVAGRGCTFQDNTTVYGGGAFYLYNATATMDSCLFAGNNCTNGGGGAVHANQSGSVAILTGCTFSDNEANSGAAVYARYSGRIDVANSIMANSTRGAAIGCDGSGVLTVTCSDLFANADGDGLTCLASPVDGGTIFVAPGFCGSTSNPYLLQNDSPCLAVNNSCGVRMGAYGVGCSSVSTVIESDLPERSFLAANYPNPFNPQTVLSFGLTEPARTSLVIYDLSGRVVRRLVSDEDLAAGVHSYRWQGRDDGGKIVAAGTYLYRIQAGTYVATRKMTMLK